MALDPHNVKPVSNDPYIVNEEDMMLIKKGHYDALLAYVDAANTALQTEITAVKPYKEWVGLVSQKATAAPTADVLHNDFDDDIVWAYAGVGIYTGTLVGAFPDSGATAVFLTSSTDPSQNYVRISRNDDDSFYLFSTLSNGAGVDNRTGDLTLTIRVYPGVL